ncbi:HAD family hydrolase [Desulfosudis oleivorans]|uniref:HAD-superfamily hydrolase, subfamily IA, variant 3 n=1 Tax=Desulfosudis oleivorans (strain DSM 6200 / JCM 39069 / Hxd3) TaxID=96561 RepID=A8ZU69_DESOH|nr:HAD family phosphatase [Desulfosudis oleivorans]ABW66381.1 HAD-superfamily hydrolase, subfamily IA, variant 3 [Desulfosudis oleivorans Hxd3]
MKTDKVTTILFDLGGVLFELSGIQKISHWTGGRLAPADLLERWLASPSVRAFECGRIDFFAFRHALKQELELAVSDDEFEKTFRAWIRQVFPGTKELLADLAPRYRLACFSNTNDVHWQIIRSDFDVLSCFEKTFASCEIGLVKPDAEAFDHVLAGLGCGPGQVLFFDDSPTNVAAAEACGMNARRVYGAQNVRQVLIDMGLL